MQRKSILKISKLCVQILKSHGLWINIQLPLVQSRYNSDIQEIIYSFPLHMKN